jgi:hypothetical protein
LRFCDFGNVFVRVGVVDFVERDDGREFLVGEGVYYKGDCGVAPVLQGFFEGEFVEDAGYD